MDRYSIRTINNIPADSTGNITITGSGNYIEVTKTELDTLISTSTLSIGATYKITGVHPTLYDDGTSSGTTIYLQALTNNKLAKEGYGVFYNPKYAKVSFMPPDIPPVYDYYIWDNTCTFMASSLSVTSLTSVTSVTTDNGATGKLINYRLIEGKNFFVPTSAGWESAISIVMVDGIATTADITNVTLKTYNIGDKAWWGGYCWINLNGLVGESINILTLNAEWEKVPYDLINYDLTLDVIEYDHENDWICRRSDVNGNDVRVSFMYGQFIMTYLGYLLYGDYVTNPIAAFMFGSDMVRYNYVEDSYFSCISTYARIGYNNLKMYSVISSITTSPIADCEISSNILRTSFIFNNVLDFSDDMATNINGNTLDNSQIRFNIFKAMSGNNLNNSEIASNNVDMITSNNLDTNCEIALNNMRGNGQFNDIKYITNNTLSDISNLNNNTSSLIRDNILHASEINRNNNNGYSIFGNSLILSTINDNMHIGMFHNNLNHSNFNYNSSTILDNTYNISDCVFKNSTINNNIFSNYLDNINFETATVTGLTLSTSTHIYYNNTKVIYGRPDGTPKLRYYGDNDVLVIADITD